MSEVNFMLPADEHFDPAADQNAYDAEFYRIAAENDFDTIFGTELTTEIPADHLIVNSNAPDTFTKNNTDTDKGNQSGD